MATLATHPVLDSPRLRSFASGEAARRQLHEELSGFVYNGQRTETTVTGIVLQDRVAPVEVPTYVNEFWTSRQRQAHSLHEVSYRACFKPQLPKFFIDRLTRNGDAVYDPFMGRGTTLLEAALLGRRPHGCDINPLSRALIAPRLCPPSVAAVAQRLDQLDLAQEQGLPEDLLAFYHPETLGEIAALRRYLLARQTTGTLDAVDAWIRMVAVNRLTGHSPGFFSVYTMPPNQAVSVEVQKRINERRNQIPPRRDVRALILAKTRSLLKDLVEDERTLLTQVSVDSRLCTRPAHSTPELAAGTIELVVTSPPFLDVVDYAADNWLRCWFCGVDPASVEITMARKLADWEAAMARVFRELYRVVRPGGHVAFEVGEVRGGRVRLEETVIPAAASAGFLPELILINQQDFTKTANCWGVTNNTKGTNTNRVVLLVRPPE